MRAGESVGEEPGAGWAPAGVGACAGVGCRFYGLP